MKNMIRMCVFVIVVAGIAFGAATYIGAAHGERASSRSSVPMPSQVHLSEDASGALVGFRVVAGDALVIRLSGADMTSCALKIYTGPQDGSEHAAPGIVVDYQVVPIDSWRDEVARLGQSCGEYWYTIA